MTQPTDQDFDLNLVASDPRNVLDIEMVRVKPGQEERFQELRHSYITKARNSRNVRNVVTFKVGVGSVFFTSPKTRIFGFEYPLFLQKTG